MSWGPLVGGTGVREPHSLPSVDFSFGDLPPMHSHGAKLADALNAIMEKGFVEEDDAVRASSPPSRTHRIRAELWYLSQLRRLAESDCSRASCGGICLSLHLHHSGLPTQEGRRYLHSGGYFLTSLIHSDAYHVSREDTAGEVERTTAVKRAASSFTSASGTSFGESGKNTRSFGFWFTAKPYFSMRPALVALSP